MRQRAACKSDGPVGERELVFCPLTTFGEEAL
jgi:hypothetical protein